jgi:phosphomevalonate kinase
VKVIAPGKLLLSGAYAVLEGAPALVVAVDRCAVADGSRRAASPTPEVLAVLRPEDAPEVDASALRDGASKLGLGSSAAMLVASLGVAYVRAKKDLRALDVRRALFLEARAGHAKVQSGGSGVDVAASVYGGALKYTVASEDRALAEPTALPTGVVLDVFWCGAPAATTAMRARVTGLRDRDATVYRARIGDIEAASVAAIAAGRAGDMRAFLDALRAGSGALALLGRDADAPIVPASAGALVPLAEADGAAFLPSGAGGGDVFVHVASSPSSSRFRAAAVAAGMRLIPMLPDLEGVRVLPGSS